MSGKNFSPGDTVQRVAPVGALGAGRAGIRQAGVYVVEDAGLSCGNHVDHGVIPCINLVGIPSFREVWGPEICAAHCHSGWAAECFRLITRPDPEVSREYTETPVKLKEPAQ